MRLRFIEEHRRLWPIAVQCDVLDVTRAGYYAWRKRGPSRTAQRRAELAKQIQEIHDAHRNIYGSPRVHQELNARGVQCDRKTVAKIMKEAGICSKTHKKFRVTTTDSNHQQPIAPNVLDRKFNVRKRNQAWVADITYIHTQEGWLYLAAVEDLFSRKIVGWAMSEYIDSRLVVNALQMAVQRQLPGEGLVAHSDRGVQYASEHYQRLLANNAITCSMSRKGNCWDNAPMESFFATLKKELVHHESYQTRKEASRSLFDYIEVFYNRIRRHSAIGYLSPEQFEVAT